jgi:hypothetical protein
MSVEFDIEARNARRTWSAAYDKGHADGMALQLAQSEREVRILRNLLAAAEESVDDLDNELLDANAEILTLTGGDMTRLWLTGVTPDKMAEGVLAMRKLAVATATTDGELATVINAVWYFDKLAAGEAEPLLVAVVGHSEEVEYLTSIMDKGYLRYAL